MKYVLLLLCLTLLITGCGNNTEDLNQTISTTNETNMSIVEETNDVVVEETEVIEEILVEEEEDLTDIEPLNEGTLNLATSDLTVSTFVYTDDEEYELTMIWDETEANEYQTTIITLEPYCSEDQTLVLSVNNKVLQTETLSCKEENIIELETDFVAGPNRLTLQSKATEDYELENVLLTFIGETTSVNLTADDYKFSESSQTLSTLKSLSNVHLTNSQTITFKLSERQIGKDLYLAMDFSNTEGELTILLNDERIYRGEPSDTQQLKLPQKHLVEGRNTLEFIGK